LLLVYLRLFCFLALERGSEGLSGPACGTALEKSQLAATLQGVLATFIKIFRVI
jgi:hypothetical protein